MGQFVAQSKTLKGVLRAVESRVPLFDTFTKDSSALITDVLDQESVHRCILGSSA